MVRKVGSELTRPGFKPSPHTSKRCDLGKLPTAPGRGLLGVSDNSRCPLWGCSGDDIRGQWTALSSDSELQICAVCVVWVIGGPFL